MNEVKIAPGLYEIRLSDEERRKKFKISEEAVQAFEGEGGHSVATLVQEGLARAVRVGHPRGSKKRSRARKRNRS